MKIKNLFYISLLLIVNACVQSRESSSQYIVGDGAIEGDNDLGPAVTKEFDVTLNEGDFSEIHLSILGVNKIEVVPASDQKIKFSAKVHAKRAELVDAFLSSVKIDSDKMKASVSAGSNSIYRCLYRQVNSDIKVAGLCVNNLQVAIAKDSKAKIFLNGRLVYIPDSMKVTCAELVEMLKLSSASFEKLDLVSKLAEKIADPENMLKVIKEMSFVDELKAAQAIVAGVSRVEKPRFLTAKQAVEIVYSQTFDTERTQMASLFSGRVSDRENVIFELSQHHDPFNDSEKYAKLLMK